VLFTRLLVSLLGAVALSAAPATQTFTGVVTDDNCVNGDHSHMRMGDTDAECTVACINAHGASYVLFDGKAAYTLSDQKTPVKFAGQKVTVVGSLDAKTKTIQVSAIRAAK
jgi:streptogramin lyase